MFRAFVRPEDTYRNLTNLDTNYETMEFKAECGIIVITLSPASHFLEQKTNKFVLCHRLDKDSSEKNCCCWLVFRQPERRSSWNLSELKCLSVDGVISLVRWKWLVGHFSRDAVGWDPFLSELPSREWYHKTNLWSILQSSSKPYYLIN